MATQEFRTYEDMRADCAGYAEQASGHGYDVQVIHWTTALDNHEPARSYVSGHAVIYSGQLRHAEYPTAGIYMPCDDASALPLGNAVKTIALFDDGRAVAPYYCAGWNDYESVNQRDRSLHFGATGPYVLWHPFPLSQGVRPDNGRPVDMSGWMLGPRRAYHFKVTPLYLSARGQWIDGAAAGRESYPQR